jgi:hypothetical protein
MMRKAQRQQLQDMVLQWVIVWALIGLSLGIVQLMRTGAVSWIPALGLGAAAGGLCIGVLYAGLMVATENWRDSLADTPGVLAQAGTQMLCGAAAGLIPGSVAGGISGGLFFGAIAACTAALFNWKSVQEGLRARPSGRKPAKVKGSATR